jgi:hypothetical protein
MDDRIAGPCYPSESKLHECDFSRGDASLVELLKVRVRVTGVISPCHEAPRHAKALGTCWRRSQGPFALTACAVEAYT